MILAWIFASKVRAIATTLALLALVGGAYWLWIHPDRINPTADGYRLHAIALQTDSAKSVRVIAGLRGVILHKDSIIVGKDTIILKLNTQAERATAYANTYQAKLSEQIRWSDQKTSQLTNQQKQIALLRLYKANGTLSPWYQPTAAPIESFELLDAGLNTAKRDSIRQAESDSLSLAVGRRDAKIQRLGDGLSSFAGKVHGLSTTARTKAKGGIWPINVKRKKQLNAVADQADQIANEADSLSELEVLINKKH